MPVKAHIKPKEKKKQMLETLEKLIPQYPYLIFTDFKGLDIETMNQIRKTIKEKNGQYKVFKNNIIEIALYKYYKDLPEEKVDKLLTGNTGIAFLTDENLQDIMKELIKLSKNTPIRLKGGIISGYVVEEEKVKELANLPSRKELIAQILGLLNYAIGGVINVFNNVIGDLVLTIKAIEEKKK